MNMDDVIEAYQSTVYGIALTRTKSPDGQRSGAGFARCAGRNHGRKQLPTHKSDLALTCHIWGSK